MKKISVLTQLAIAGIAAGLVSTAHADNHGTKKSGDSARAEKSGCKGKAVVKSGNDKSSCGGPGGCGAKDSALGKKVAAPDAKSDAKASCRGKNACKGQGGCAMTDKQLEKRAKELGIPREQAGKAHSCKGKNECKGLGGCNM